MDAADVALIRKTFENALGGASGDAVALLRDLGWDDLHTAEPAVAVAELFGAQGRLRRATNALDIVVGSALGTSVPKGTAVVHPGLAAWDGPPAQLAGSGSDDLRFDGLVLAGAEDVARLLVPVPRADGRVEAIWVDRANADLRPIGGLDPDLQLVAVSGPIERPSSAPAEPGWGWETVALGARRALSYELCGLAQVMLDTAAAHVTERHQFGRPIAAFQTVRHRMTEVFVTLASARAALDASWADDDPLLGDVAKALAGRAGLLAARHCLQVTGAIGFTEEYPLAARIRRVAMLDALYGSADQLRSRVGARLLAAGEVPRLRPLP